ncbi:uncharacterized serpin-like protein TK1782 [Trichonephila clavipes]|nr:uncharacterized serpin-like protein TK1782 [Trichonephila clavipes]
MMRMTARLEYYGDNSLQMIELPFRGEIFSMFILLPRNRGGFKTLEEGFEHALEGAVYTTQERRVTVTLPKFHFNYSVNLTQSICDMGVATICKPGIFDLSEMVSKELVTMGGVLHKSFVEISEEGMNLADYGIEEKYKLVNEKIFWKFDANHPFIFSIVDSRSGTILFLGSVKNFECEDCDSK